MQPDASFLVFVCVENGQMKVGFTMQRLLYMQAGGVQ